jgi:hypothetical protein
VLLPIFKNLHRVSQRSTEGSTEENPSVEFRLITVVIRGFTPLQGGRGANVYQAGGQMFIRQEGNYISGRVAT